MSGYIGNIPVPQATQTRDSFTCTAGQTVFATGGYTPQFLDVYLNGIFLNNGTDYTASNGSDVILTAAASADDTLEVVAYTTFEVANVTGADNFTVTGSFTSQGIDDNATSTAMTLDASGNLLVGTTDTLAYNAGARISQQSLVVTNTSATATDYIGYFNRQSSDGTILQFGKANSSVGSIGTTNSVGFGTTYLEGTANSSGLLFGNIEILPHRNGARSNGLIDIGDGDYRFKDLYLSGGVYLGGTGSTNKLDDYEEGTWDCTPSTSQSSLVPLPGWTLDLTAGHYTKVGRVVTCTYLFQWTNTNSSTSFIYMVLPFSSTSSNGGQSWAGNITETSSVDYPSGASNVSVRVEQANTYASFKGCGDGLLRVDMRFSNFGSFANGYALGTFTYFTDA